MTDPLKTLVVKNSREILLKRELKSIEMMRAVKQITPLLEKMRKQAFKAGYEKGFSVGAKSRPSKTLSRHRFLKR